MTNLSAIVVDLSATTKPVTNYTGNTWKLTTAIPFSLSANQVEQAAVQAPNVSVILSPIRSSPNLSVFAQTIRDVQASSLSTASSRISSASASFKLKALPALENIKANMSSIFSPIKMSVLTQIEGIRGTISSFFTLASSYEMSTTVYRVLFVAVYVLPILFAFFGIFTKSPRLMKGYRCLKFRTNCFCIPYYVLLHVFAIIFLLLTYIISDGCTVVFDTGPVSINGSLGTSINLGLGVVGACYANGSLLDIAQSTGLVSANTINISALATSQLNSLDFSAVSNFDIK